MTFFEKELHRLFDDSECISADAVFAGKTMIAPIGEDLRAKVQFVNTNTHAKYDALRLTIINRHEGTVDSETFKFKDILGMKGDREPHIWGSRSPFIPRISLNLKVSLSTVPSWRLMMVSRKASYFAWVFVFTNCTLALKSSPIGAIIVLPAKTASAEIHSESSKSL